ncbi:MAG: FAD-dependent oxidoreductase [Bacilli bacterium]|nr:FAD-dependent oxidoreductase [Bacilli bacterium]
MYDSIIVGGGPSGMTAALYLLRSGKSVLILERDSFGGQAAKSPRLENFPSIKSIAGIDFADQLFSQIMDLGAEFEAEDCQKIEKRGDTFVLTTDYNTYEARSVILATGCKHRQLGLEREEELVGHGISYCAVCDGAYFEGKDVLLIGDANTALQYAILLAQTSTKVTIATLFDKFFADPILVKKMGEFPNIEYFHNLEAHRFLGSPDLTAVEFINTKTKESKTIPCAGCFIAIGQVPDNDRFAELVDLEKGFIVTDESMATKTPGLFACGDCRVKKIRQVVTATNDGAIAGLSAFQYLG